MGRASREKLRKQKRQKRLKRISLLTCLGLATVFVGLLWYRSEQEEARQLSRQKQQKLFRTIINTKVFEPDYLATRDYKSTKDLERPTIRVSMTEQELSDFFVQNVLGEMKQALDDPQELPFIRHRLAWVFEQQNRGVIVLDIAFTPAPGHDDAIASSFVQNNQRYITFIGPAIYSAKQRLKPEAYHDLIVLTAVHESLHTTEFLQKHHSRTEKVQDEADVWAETITEVIMPWYRQGRHPGNVSWKIAKFFKKCQLDKRHPDWLELFKYFTN